MKAPFQIDRLADVDDGRVAAAVDLAIEQVAKDCVDRPGDNSKRTVKLEMTLKPEQGEDGSCESAAVEFEIKASLPARKSKTFQMGTMPSGGLIFNPASEKNILQHTLDEVPGDPEGGAS